jgi:hypothetical protein
MKDKTAEALKRAADRGLPDIAILIISPFLPLIVDLAAVWNRFARLLRRRRNVEEN